MDEQWQRFIVSRHFSGDLDETINRHFGTDPHTHWLIMGIHTPITGEHLILYLTPDTERALVTKWEAPRVARDTY